MLERWALVALMMLPMLAFGQNKMVSSVCADPQRKKSCITAQSALALVLPGARQSKSEALLSERKSARLVYLQPLSLSGSQSLALGMTEVVEKDASTGSRLDCRGCAPNMIISVFEASQGIWRLAAQSQELDGVGGLGELRIDAKTVDLGRRRLLIQMETGFTGQGVTETASAYYFADLEPRGRQLGRIIDIGFIPTGVYACDGLMGQEANISQTQVLIRARGDLLPDFVAVQTEIPCDGSKAAETGPPLLYRVNPRTLKIELAQ